ncbi:MAG: hypothetical protein M1820_010413 [Bogoriella megaspora]|nr:MAG: hypothetical protein M1820_010413 [Bogoriella megaspora]
MAARFTTTQNGPPFTPKHKSHDEVNNIVDSFAKRHNLPLQRRDSPFSPEHHRSGVSNKCYNRFRELFYRNRAAIKDVDRDLQKVPASSTSERLGLLLDLLEKACREAQDRLSRERSWKQQLLNTKRTANTISPPRGESALQSIDPNISTSRKQDDLSNIQLGGPVQIFHISEPSTPRTQRSPRKNENKSSGKALADQVETPLSRRHDGSFYTAPDSPVTPESPTLVALRGRTSSRGSRKRASDETSVDSFHSVSPSKRPCSGHGENKRSPQGDLSASYSTAATAGSPLLSSQPHDGATTVNTSFTSTGVPGTSEPKELILNERWLNSSSDDSIQTELQRRAASAERDRVLYPKLDQVREMVDNDMDIEPVSQSMEDMKIGNHIVHHVIRDMPTRGLFCDDTPAHLLNQSYASRYECCRVALAGGISVSQLMDGYSGNLDDIDNLWLHFGEKLKQNSLSKPAAASEWKSARQGSAEITYSGSLSFNTSPKGPIFQLRLAPLKAEKSCRFQRAYGSDRFLYLTVPALNNIPLSAGHLKNQQDTLDKKYLQWLLTEHKFLGRTWRVIMIEPRKTKKSIHQTEPLGGHKLVLLATEGSDIDNIQSDPLITDAVQQSASTRSLGHAINWFLSLNRNLSQTFCKAYSRLELGFSKTTATVIFKPSQIRRVNDTLADASQEDSRFNDPRLNWEEPPEPDMVMNDGCGRISLGAMQEIWRILGKTGPIPSAIQGRIAGAKGIWFLSAPTDTTSAEHREIWIEITDSQLKFSPHEEDLHDSTFDPRRTTFELLKYSQPLRSTTLHLSFLPILKDRGVPVEKLRSQIEGHLDSERDILMQTLDDPVKLRMWINARHSMLEESSRDGEVPWAAGLPLMATEKVILLLEVDRFFTHLLHTITNVAKSGFEPITCRFLATAVFRVVNMLFSMTLRTLSIPLGRSTNTIAIADPYGILAPGEIHLAFSQTFRDEQSGEDIMYLDSREALVARHPTLRRSDIQKVRAVFNPQLSHLRDVVVFSTKGQVPLAHKCQGGDYDGDVFWVCWEPLLVKDFKNAPAPSNRPTPESYGIGVDRTQLRAIVDDKKVDHTEEFLKRSFGFRCRPEMLGIVTNAHEKLTYAENNLDTPAANGLADMHDYLVDSSKNGFSFNRQDFARYKQLHGIRINAEPAYKKITKAKLDIAQMGQRRDINRYAYMHNPDHVVDKLVFEVVQPHIHETLCRVESKFSNAGTFDAELASVSEKWSHRAYRHADQPLKDEIEHLKQRLEPIRRSWGVAMAKGIELDNKEDYFSKLEQHFQWYLSVQPRSPSPLHGSWQDTLSERKGSHDPTEWDLLKASMLHSMSYTSTAFAFNMAGNELARLKAAASPQGDRRIVYSVYQILKPGKLKLDRIADEGDGEDDDANSDGVAESIIEDAG